MLTRWDETMFTNITALGDKNQIFSLQVKFLLNVEAHAGNPSTWEVEPNFMSLKPTWTTREDLLSEKKHNSLQSAAILPLCFSVVCTCAHVLGGGVVYVLC